MGRTRPKTKKVKPVITENTAESAAPPSVPALLEKAQELIVRCEYELAGRFASRVLEREPGNVEAQEILGVVQLETGELEAAKQVRLSSCTVPSVLSSDYHPHAFVDIPITHTPKPRCPICPAPFCPSIPGPIERR